MRLKAYFDRRPQVWENIEDKETTQDNKSRVGVLLLAFVFAWWTLPVLVL